MQLIVKAQSELVSKFKSPPFKNICYLKITCSVPLKAKTNTHPDILSCLTKQWKVDKC